MIAERLTVAPGTCLLHIGPHKTGSTAVQYAFHAAREQLAEHGVVYPGEEHQPRHAACAVTGAKIAKGAGQPRRRDWEALVAEVAEARDDQRVVISSEYFSNADDAATRTIVEGLGGERVQVLVTLRPLVKILPSQWQEYVKGGLHVPYDEWLDRIFQDPPDDAATPSFWRRHQHGTLVERWAKVLGPENLTVVVNDESDRMRQLRVFEEFAGLPEGLLVPGSTGSNHSLTYSEAELLRTLNQKLRKHKLGADEYGNLVRRGVGLRMLGAHGPDPGEDRIVTPAWAVEKALAASAEATAAISALGVRIVGDLDSLTKPPGSIPEGAPPQTVPVPLAADAAAGVVAAARKQLQEVRQQLEELRNPPEPPPARLQDRPLGEVGSRTLLRVVAGRGLRRVGLRRRPTGSRP